ncbi:UNVERIFIED_CONTAM: hypothetical protein GTU68_049563 [Idotea baltica]|nr:hypothetical protein [Idotea baltica]
MTAASGIVHEEFHSERFAKEGGMLEMVQLWVNLPAADKMSPPKYQDLLGDQFPTVTFPSDAGTARVIAGELLDAKGPASTFTPINVWDLQLSAGGVVDLQLPVGHTSLLIVQSGDARVNDEPVKAVELVLFDRDGSGVHLAADSDTRMLVLTGQPIGEPVVGQGPFVMTSRAEIQEAISDYRAGKMGTLS